MATTTDADEFVAVLHGVGSTIADARARALGIAEQLRAALKAPHRLGADATDFRASASMGVTLIRGIEQAGEEPLKQASPGRPGQATRSDAVRRPISAPRSVLPPAAAPAGSE